MGVALFLFVCAETNTCMFTAKKMPPTRKQRYMLACAQCGRDARLDAKRSKKKRCFKTPSGRKVPQGVPSSQLPYLLREDGSMNTKVCDECRDRLRRHQWPITYLSSPQISSLIPPSSFLPPSSPSRRAGESTQPIPKGNPLPQHTPFAKRLHTKSTPLPACHSFFDIPDDQYGIYRTRDWVSGCMAKPCCNATEDVNPKHPDCSGSLLFVEFKREGLFDRLIARCETCKDTICFYNSPTAQAASKEGARGFRIINVAVVLGVLLGGGTYTTYKRQTTAVSFLPKISKGTFHRIEARVWEAVSKVQQDSYTLVLNDLFARETMFILSGDGSWAHPRDSSQGTYSIIDWETKKVVYQVAYSKSNYRMVKGKEVIFEGNYDATSKSMEVAGFLECIDYLEEHDLLSKVLLLVYLFLFYLYLYLFFIWVHLVLFYLFFSLFIIYR